MNNDNLRTLSPGERLKIDRVAPCGSLWARQEKSTGRVQFYWRVNFEGRDLTPNIGYWDPVANPNSITPTAIGFSIRAAKRAAEDLALEHRRNEKEGGLPAVQRQEQEITAELQRLQINLSFHSMLEDYWQELERDKKASARDVKTSLMKHVVTAWPDLVKRPAHQITSTDITLILKKMVDKGITTHSVKMRAYLQRAFTRAMQLPHTPSAKNAGKDFGITANPVMPVKKETQYIRADKNPLSLAELRNYWFLLGQHSSHEAAMLRAHLLLGGPRIRQFAALLQEDVHEDHIVLWDGKGRSGPQARPHPLPITASIAKEFKVFGNNDHDYALCVTAGNSIAPTHLSNTAQKIVGSAIEDFQLKRVRSAVETQLASLGVNKEIRGRLQSHGVGGVQDNNYNAYEFMKEKTEALQKLEAHLQAS